MHRSCDIFRKGDVQLDVPFLLFLEHFGTKRNQAEEAEDSHQRPQLAAEKSAKCVDKLILGAGA